MSDQFFAHGDTVSAPARGAVGVVAHDVNPLPVVPKALFVGTGGNVVAAGMQGGDVTFRNVADGAVLPFRAVFVRASGTTAADIVALY